jgi:DNA-binding transcriptional regulator YhcF (GntR family)
LRYTDYLKEFSKGKPMKEMVNRGYVLTPNAIRRCLRLTQEEKLVLFEIWALNSEQKGYAFPTQQTLAMSLGMTSPSISKHLKKLEGKGFIQSSGGKGTRKRYRPSASLQTNPYILLSEWFHLAVQSFRHHYSEQINGKWGDDLLSYVNVKKADEFTSADHYGQFLIQLQTAADVQTVKKEFLQDVTRHLERQTGKTIPMDWEKEMVNRTEGGSKKPRVARDYGSKLSIAQDYKRIYYDSKLKN